MTYTEGWPKQLHATATGPLNEPVQVVPLSDAERLRDREEELIHDEAVAIAKAERLREKIGLLEARRDELVEKWNKAEDKAERLREERDAWADVAEEEGQNIERLREQLARVREEVGDRGMVPGSRLRAALDQEGHGPDPDSPVLCKCGKVLARCTALDQEG
jgi:hypothetical protein